MPDRGSGLFARKPGAEEDEDEECAGAEVVDGACADDEVDGGGPDGASHQAPISMASATPVRPTRARESLRRKVTARARAQMPMLMVAMAVA